MCLMIKFLWDNNRLTEKDSCLLMNGDPSFRKSGCRLSGTGKENSYMHIQNGGSPKTLKGMMMMVMMLEAASKAYEEWLSFVEQREEDER